MFVASTPGSALGGASVFSEKFERLLHHVAKRFAW
jgi:hypothetical protein